MAQLAYFIQTAALKKAVVKVEGFDPTPDWAPSLISYVLLKEEKTSKTPFKIEDNFVKHPYIQLLTDYFDHQINGKNVFAVCRHIIFKSTFSQKF